MTKNFAHRGFSGLYPENTMLAFEKAIEIGCDGIETDVHLTKDNQLVMIHDEALFRTTGEKGFVWDYTLEQIKQFDASYKDNFGEKFSGNKIPSLREYFERVKDEKKFVTNIELKTGINEYPGIEKAVLELIDEYDLRDRIIISSFNHFSVMRFKKLAPDVKCGFLTADWIVDAGKYTKEHGVECIHPILFNLTEECFREMKDNEIEVNTWTINEKVDIERLAKMGVDALIGNYPDRIKHVLENLK